MLENFPEFHLKVHKLMHTIYRSYELYLNVLGKLEANVPELVLPSNKDFGGGASDLKNKQVKRETHF